MVKVYKVYVCSYGKAQKKGKGNDNHLQICEFSGDSVSFRRFIAVGFDLLHCCIAVTITSDLRIDIEESMEGAYEAARRRQLHIRGASFKHPKLELHRILKYIRRDFLPH